MVPSEGFAAPPQPILCVTPNPSIDRTTAVPDFAVGGVCRAVSVTAICGGKGVNVARVLHRLGWPAIAAGPIGGHTGQHAAALAGAEGLRTAWTWVTADTRVSAIIVDPGTGDATVVNEPGPMIAPNDWDRLIDDTATMARNCAAVAISGSFPRSVSEDEITRLIRTTYFACQDIYVDTSGPALAQAIAAGAPVIKVNGEELGVVLGETVETHAQAIDAGRRVARQGIAIVAITLGGDGAVLVDATGAWTATAPHVEVVNPVGSGDAFLAGLAVGRASRRPPDECLRYAVATGTANALGFSGGEVSPQDVDRLLPDIVVTQVEG